MSQTKRQGISRRHVLQRVGMGLAAAPFVHLLGCGTDTNTTADTTIDGGTQSGVDGGTIANGNDGTAWAVGTGTFLAGKSYSAPFASGIGSSCTAYKSATEGPCHSNTFVRQDITEGQMGLPMRLQLLILDVSCSPVANANVEIWHCSTGGLYSGAPVNGVVGSDLQVGMCTGNDAEALAAGWFRGYGTTGADGIATFDSLMPGWYSSRATHIHFQISVGSTNYVTSQVFFDEALKTEIYGSHANYSSRPTTRGGYVANTSDKVVMESGLTLSDVVVNTRKAADGALLAWKAITLSG